MSSENGRRRTAHREGISSSQVSAPQAIPGFYYDEVRKKYFKVQPSHVAPQGSKYSEDAVKREAKTQLLQQTALAVKEQNQRERFVRSRIYHHPLGGRLSLQREIGNMMADNGSNMASWAMGLSKRVCVESDHLPYSAACLVSDDDTRSLIYGTSHGIWFALRTCNRELVRYDDAFDFRCSNQTSSLSLSSSRIVMATDTGSGSKGPIIHLAKLKSPESFLKIGTGREYALVEEHSRIESKVDDVFWASSARPTPTSTDFALGSSNGTLLVSCVQSTWKITQRQYFQDAIPSSRSDVLDVDWLDSNVTLNGFRNGAVKLWDVRIQGLGGFSQGFQHPSSITHLRHIDAQRIAVAGLKHHLCIYDLRFLSKAAHTKALLSFSSYRNEGRPGTCVGFDVCNGVIAASSDQGIVQLFDCNEGNELEASIEAYSQPPRSLRFVKGDGTCEAMRLVVATEDEIEEWGWHR